MANRALRLKDFVIIAALVRFVTKKVDLVKLVQETQREGLVPTSRENVERDLTAD